MLLRETWKWSPFTFTILTPQRTVLFHLYSTVVFYLYSTSKANNQRLTLSQNQIIVRNLLPSVLASLVTYSYQSSSSTGPIIFIYLFFFYHFSTSTLLKMKMQGCMFNHTIKFNQIAITMPMPILQVLHHIK